MARYLLMNKNTPVLEFDYDLEVHAVMKILEVHDARYATENPEAKVQSFLSVVKALFLFLPSGNKGYVPWLVEAPLHNPPMDSPILL